MAGRRECEQIRAFGAAMLAVMPSLSPGGQRLAALILARAVSSGSASVPISAKQVRRNLRMGGETFRAARQNLVDAGMVEIVHHACSNGGDEATEYVPGLAVRRGCASAPAATDYGPADKTAPRGGDKTDPGGRTKQAYPRGTNQTEGGGQNGPTHNREIDKIDDDRDRSDQSARVPVDAWLAAEDAVSVYAEHGVEVDLTELALLASDLRERGLLPLLAAKAVDCASYPKQRNPVAYLRAAVQYAAANAPQPRHSSGPSDRPSEPGPNCMPDADTGASNAMSIMAGWSADESQHDGSQDG